MYKTSNTTLIVPNTIKIIETYLAKSRFQFLLHSQCSFSSSNIYIKIPTLHSKTINGKINSSFDCVTISPTKRIQVKSCSVSYDLTSFGPKSVWDELYFVHFYPNQKYDGSYKIFKIENELIYNHKVNIGQTMRDQQKQGKRPRFGIMKEIIEPLNLNPIIDATLPNQN